MPWNMCPVLPFSAQTFPQLLISFRGKNGKAYSGPKPYVICLLTTPLPHFLLVSPASLGFSHSDLHTVLLIHRVPSYMGWFFFTSVVLFTWNISLPNTHMPSFLTSFKSLCKYYHLKEGFPDTLKFHHTQPSLLYFSPQQLSPSNTMCILLTISSHWNVRSQSERTFVS